MSLRTEPNSSDMQWYDRAIELGAMSTEKDKWNYAAHYEYHGTFGNIHKFVDAWNGTKLWIDFYSKIFEFIPADLADKWRIEKCQKLKS